MKRILTVTTFLFILVNQLCAQWTNIGFYSAHIRSLAVKDSSLFAGEYNNYYQGAGGSVYRSTDGGKNWFVVGYDSISYPVVSMAVMDAFIFVSTQGGGVFRSSDNGINWRSINSGLPNPSGFFGNYIYVIAAKGNILFAGTNEGGLYRSSNYGSSWLGANTPPPPSILSFAFSNDTIFAGVTEGIYISTNGGVDFNFLSSIPCYAEVLAFKNGYLFANRMLTGDTSGNNGLYRSSDGGKTWTHLTNGLQFNPEVFSLFMVNNCIFVSTYNYENASHGFFRSNNNGDSWTDINAGIFNNVGVVSYAVQNDILFIGTSASGVWENPLSVITNIKNKDNMAPLTCLLSQNYPNPFNPSTTINFHVSSMAYVTLAIYNMLGQKISTLLNERKSPGVYNIMWDASSMPSGTYFYRLQIGSFFESKKMILLR